ncbi:DUF805 domain-containing protein [bacterium]|nr:DUF805 domain-containing protein [bacterium]
MEEKNIFQYYVEAITKNYGNFNGRARRKEYWGFVLINLLVSWGLALGLGAVSPELSIVSTIYSLAVLIPSLALAVRRMHDVGKSGWFILIPIYNLILALTAGDVGANEYGPDPKNPEMGLEVDQIGTE